MLCWWNNVWLWTFSWMLACMSRRSQQGWWIILKTLLSWNRYCLFQVCIFIYLLIFGALRTTRHLFPLYLSEARNIFILCLWNSATCSYMTLEVRGKKKIYILEWTVPLPPNVTKYDYLKFFTGWKCNQAVSLSEQIYSPLGCPPAPT